MSDDLLSDEELAEAKLEAEEILRQPAKEYSYRDPNYKGGPRNTDVEELTAAAIELTTARVVIEEYEDRLSEARVQRIERIEEMLAAGIPVDFIAEHSGMKHRSSVYRAMKLLPKQQEQRDRARQLRAAVSRQVRE